jgi:ketosteroid isomerase-like protein
LPGVSQENIERGHRVLDAFNRRDLDAFIELMDPNVEFTTRFMELEGESYYCGHDGIRKWWEDLLAYFPDFKVEVVEMRDLGELVIGTVDIRGHGVDSDAPFEQRVWQAGQWRGGKLVWWQTFGSEAGAVEAARRRE